MVFRRRLRRPPKGAANGGGAAATERGAAAAPPVARDEAAESPSSVSLTSGRSSPSPKAAPRNGDPGGSGSTVTRGTGSAEAMKPINTLPPGMPEMPSTPPHYARLGERRVSEIDKGFNAMRASGSIDSRDSRGSRWRLRRVFGRAPRSARSTRTLSVGTASEAMDDVPGAEDVGRSSSLSEDDGRGKMQSLREAFLCPPAAYASAPRADYDYGEEHLREEHPQSRLKLCDLSTKGRFVRVAEDVSEAVRVHDNHISFVVPHGWIATRTRWGFYLSCRDSLGFIMATSAKDAARHLIDTNKLSVLSEVEVMSSPLFESRHRAVVKYAAHDLEGRGVAQYDIGFYPGATVFGLCAPRSMQSSLNRVEDRLAASAVVLNVPTGIHEDKVKTSSVAQLYEPSKMLGLSNGTNCVMQ